MSLMRKLMAAKFSAPKVVPSRVPRAARRARQSEGQLRRNAPVVTNSPEIPESSRRDTAPVEEPIRGEPLPPLAPPPAPLERAVELAAQAAPEKAAAAAELEAKRAAIEASARWRGSCKAIDAVTGLQCGLLAGHTLAHRNARGPFIRTVSEPTRRVLDAAAWATTH